MTDWPVLIREHSAQVWTIATRYLGREEVEDRLRAAERLHLYDGHRLNPSSYLRDVLDQLAAHSVTADVDDLLPDTWTCRQLAA